MKPGIQFIIMKIFMKIVKICPKSPRFTVLQITILVHVSARALLNCGQVPNYGQGLRTGVEQRVNCFCTRKTLHRDSKGKGIIDILDPQIAAEKCIFKVYY